VWGIFKQFYSALKVFNNNFFGVLRRIKLLKLGLCLSNGAGNFKFFFYGFKVLRRMFSALGY